MSLVKFERIVSVSSEDPAFPAENLLKSDYSDKKWKCKSPGEKQLSVVIQLNSAVVINAIDIGNYGSAFIEVFVGKSSNPDEFKVLVVASSLMTLQEAKLGENMTNVRFFKENYLVKPVASEKWDRIKLVCSQPYNKFIQYGLSFVVVHSKNVGASESAVPTLGKFVLKPKDDADNIAAGSLFAKRKEKVAESKVAAAIRAASNSGVIFQKKKSKLTAPNVSPDQERVFMGKIGKNKNSVQDNNFSTVLRKDSSKKQKIDGTKTPKAKPNSVRNGSSAQGSSTLLGTQPPKRSIDIDHYKPKSKKKIIPNQRPEKPFNQLMDGVVFTISGFQNPYRSDLRSKAIAMGAKYKPDWDNSCTHLLCAFPNTPKFNQVLGHGKIITKEWIESCYSRRMRLPWRRFALHRPDKNLPESEEEIFEYVPRPPSPVDNRRRLSPGRTSSGEDTEEEIEKVRMLQNKIHNDDSQENISSKKDVSNIRNSLFDEVDNSDITIQSTDDQKDLKESEDSEASFLIKETTKKAFKKNKLKESKDAYPNKKKEFDMTEDLKIDEENMSEDIPPMEMSTLTNGDDKPGPSWRFRDVDVYEMDTEVEPEESDSKQYNLPLLVVFYEGIQFFIGQDISIEERKKLERYIIAHKGSITDKENSDVEFIVSRSASEVELVKTLCPIAIGVRPEWIWMCHDRNYLPPPTRFEIK